MSEIENALNDLGEQLVNSLKSSLQSAKPGSESLAAGIQASVQPTSNGFTFRLSLPETYKWVDEGRMPGKFPPQLAIINWINKKGIQTNAKKIIAGKIKALVPDAQAKSLAYLIGRKIANEGIPATDFYSKVVNESLNNQLNTLLSVALKQDCLNQITK